MASSSPRLGIATPPKTPITIISGMGKATDFKYGRYVHRVYPNKRPLKILEKGNMGNPGTAPIFCLPLIMSGTGKATNFKFGSIGTKAH